MLPWNIALELCLGGQKATGQDNNQALHVQCCLAQGNIEYSNGMLPLHVVLGNIQKRQYSDSILPWNVASFGGSSAAPEAVPKVALEALEAAPVAASEEPAPWEAAPGAAPEPSPGSLRRPHWQPHGQLRGALDCLGCASCGLKQGFETSHSPLPFCPDVAFSFCCVL